MDKLATGPNQFESVDQVRILDPVETLASVRDDPKPR